MAGPSRLDRFIALLFGLVFCGIALAIVLLAQPLSTGPVIAAVVLGGLGLDAVVSAVRGTQSLLSRIGPLP